MEKNIVRSCLSGGQKPSDYLIWVFDIEMDQGCGNEGLHKPMLLATESFVGEEKNFWATTV